jgi:hypothetical protein
MPTIDEELTRRFTRAELRVNSTDVVSRVRERAGAAKARRRIGTAALAIVVGAGTLAGVVVLDRAFRETPAPADTSPNITPSPAEATSSPTAEPTPEGKDIGLASNVCQAARLDGLHLSGADATDTVWTGYPVSEAGRCVNDPDRQHWLVAVDRTGDGLVDFSGPLPLVNCPYVGCQPLGATDLDADGDDELVVMSLFSIIDHMFFSVDRSGGAYSISPILVAEPGNPAAQIHAGEPLVTAAGGDEGFDAWIRCEGDPTAPVLVYTWSNFQIESNDPTEWHQTKLRLEADGMFHVVDTTDLSLPQRQDPGLELSVLPACGVDFDRLSPPNP